MENLTIIKNWPANVVLAFVLAGCAAATTSGGPVAMIPSAVSGAHRNGGTPATVPHALLYISSTRGREVTVYAYSGVRIHLVQTLTDFAEPTGECVDKKGNVFITDLNRIHKYAHGGDKAVASLWDREGSAISCSVDPVSGNLAVVNSYGPRGSSGNVLIYPKAQGPPKKYVDKSFYSPQFCAYDGRGNLYVDGYGGSGSLVFEFADLPKGAAAFSDIGIKGGTLHYPGGVVWDAPFVLVVDQQYKGQAQSAIFQLKVAAGQAHVVRSVQLSGTVGVEQFWKEGNDVIAPDRNSYVPIYKYPSGSLKGVIDKAIYDPFGAVVSQS